MNNTTHNFALIDILTPQRTCVDSQATCRKHVLQKLSELFSASLLNNDAQNVFQALLERERLGSTCIGHGVALPHARLPALTQPIAALIHTTQPIDFYSLDEQPVDLFIALLIPDQETEQHLQLLAMIAEKFENAHYRQQLISSLNNQTLFDYAIS